MKPLRQAIEDYIGLRRSLGFKLRRVAEHLQEFAGFLEKKAASYITTELALAWALPPTDHQPSDWAQRLGSIRVFARHWKATDPRQRFSSLALLSNRTFRLAPDGNRGIIRSPDNGPGSEESPVFIGAARNHARKCPSGSCWMKACRNLCGGTWLDIPLSQRPIKDGQEKRTGS